MRFFRKQATDAPHEVTAASAQLFYPWGGRELRVEDELAPHYAVMGMTSSGKTLTIRMLMRAVLVDNSDATKPRLRSRAAVYDPKRDFYPLLVGMGVPEDSIVPLHAFDERAHMWHL